MRVKYIRLQSALLCEVLIMGGISVPVWTPYRTTVSKSLSWISRRRLRNCLQNSAQDSLPTPLRRSVVGAARDRNSPMSPGGRLVKLRVVPFALLVCKPRGFETLNAVSFDIGVDLSYIRRSFQEVILETPTHVTSSCCVGIWHCCCSFVGSCMTLASLRLKGFFPATSL